MEILHFKVYRKSRTVNGEKDKENLFESNANNSRAFSVNFDVNLENRKIIVIEQYAPV